MITQKKKTALCVTAAFLFLSGVPSYAVPPEEIATPESVRAQSVVGSESTLPYMVTGDSLVGMLQDIVALDDPGASIVFNRRTAQLFVKTTPTNHSTIETILNELRNVNKRQVEIEARIITVSHTDFEGLGVDLANFNVLFGDALSDLDDGIRIGSG